MHAGEAPLTSFWGSEVRGEEPPGITTPDRAVQGRWLRVFSYLGPGPLDSVSLACLALTAPLLLLRSHHCWLTGGAGNAEPRLLCMAFLISRLK